MANCNYVLAGVDTFSSLLDNFMEKYPGYMTDESLNNFIEKSVGRFLFSYGTGLSYKTKKISNNYSDKMIKSIRKFQSPGFMKNTLTYLDSGGFQVSMGAIRSPDIPNFIEMYYSFIEQYHQEIDYAFLLDIPPGPGTTDEGIFQSYDEIYNLNKLSYERANKLSDEIKQNKMIYIHHFRTPKIYDTWKKLLIQDDLAKDYNYFSTGGLVAFGSSDITIPIVLYSIPLASIIQYCKDNNKKSFKFHVLGGANFIDVLYHQLFSLHIKKIHDIDCQITYDSSSVFKGAFNGRYVSAFNIEQKLMKMSFRSNDLHLRFDTTGTIEDKMYSLLNRIARDYNFKELSPDKESIYNKETGTLNKHIYMYVMIYVLQLYQDVEQYCKTCAEKLYKLYESKSENEFIRLTSDITKQLNQGKMSKKQKAKSVSVWNSLRVLKDLDENYHEYVINKYMAAGDSGTLESGGCLKF